MRPPGSSHVGGTKPQSDRTTAALKLKNTQRSGDSLPSLPSPVKGGGVRGQCPTGPEVPGGLDASLTELLERHIRAEQGTVAAYEEFADKTRDPWNALLVGLILEDERRHHELIKKIVATISGNAYWQRVVGVLPDAAVLKEHERAAEARTLEEFHRHERISIRELTHAARRFESRYQGLVSLLLESMAQDSLKHAQILGFLRKRVSGRTQPREAGSSTGMRMSSQDCGGGAKGLLCAFQRCRRCECPAREAAACFGP